MVDRIPVVIAERDSDGCLIVISHQPGPNGYIHVGGVYLHRMIAGAQPGDHVDHTCHNADPTCLGGACKHRLCINRDHLELLTSTGENVRRAAAGGRYRKEFCKRGHPLSEDNVYLSKNGGRQCKTCTQERSNARYRRLHSGTTL